MQPQGGLVRETWHHSAYLTAQQQWFLPRGLTQHGFIRQQAEQSPHVLSSQGPLAGPGSWQRPLTDHVIKETGHTSPAAPVGPCHPRFSTGEGGDAPS